TPPTRSQLESWRIGDLASGISVTHSAIHQLSNGGCQSISIIPDGGPPAMANAGSACGAGFGGSDFGASDAGSRGSAYRCTSRATSSSLGADGRQCSRTQT